MIWCAETNDGLILEYNNGVRFNFLDLDYSKVKNLALIQTKDIYINFNNNSGILKFPNLDLRKLGNLNNDNKLILEFDETIQNFKLSTGSLKFLNSLIYEEDSNSVIAKLTEDCKFWVNNLCIYTGIEYENNLITFTDRFQKLIHYKQGFTDFIGNNLNSPHKRIDGVSNYIIGYENNYNVFNNNLKVKCLINVNTTQRTINLEFYVTSENEFKANLCIFVNDEISKIPIHFSNNETAKFERVLAMY